MLSILVRTGVGRQVPVPMRKRLRRRLLRVLAAARRPDASVCLSLSDDAELHDLNRRFAGEDHATDVLSFGQGQALAGAASQGPLELLGDIVISVETAARQAAERGVELEAEIFHLAVHGFCHLLGYDHATPDEERTMFAYEAELRGAAPA